MSIREEYGKYCEGYERYRINYGRGELTAQLGEEEYGIHLNRFRTTLGELINNDVGSVRSDIGRRIFDSLDLSSAISFAKVSRGLCQRSRERWFEPRAREIVLKYVQQNTGYIDYAKGGGWQDFIIVAVKIAGAAITIAAGAKAYDHACRIPPDAPTKTIITQTDHGPVETTYIDHPEARSRDNWTFLSLTVGAVTTYGIISSVYTLLKNVDLDIFFSVAEEDLFGSTQTHMGLKAFSPDFHAWRMMKMKTALTSNPAGWEQIPELREMICPISGDFMLFPVQDECGHYWDYRSLIGYQLNPATENPLQCPMSADQPNTGLLTIEFDKARFDFIQRVLRQPRPHPEELV